MKQRKMLSFTLYQLGLFFRQELPGLVAQADASRDAGEFRARLEEFVARHAAAQGEAAEQIRLLIGYDGREVSELSTGEQMPAGIAVAVPHGAAGEPGDALRPVHRPVFPVQAP